MDSKVILKDHPVVYLRYPNASPTDTIMVNLVKPPDHIRAALPNFCFVHSIFGTCNSDCAGGDMDGEA